MQELKRMLKEKKSYNDRLFDGGIREKFHLARFKWVKNQLNSKKFKNLKKLLTLVAMMEECRIIWTKPTFIPVMMQIGKMD